MGSPSRVLLGVALLGLGVSALLFAGFPERGSKEAGGDAALRARPSSSSPSGSRSETPVPEARKPESSSKTALPEARKDEKPLAQEDKEPDLEHSTIAPPTPLMQELKKGVSDEELIGHLNAFKSKTRREQLMLLVAARRSKAPGVVPALARVAQDLEPVGHDWTVTQRSAYLRITVEVLQRETAASPGAGKRGQGATKPAWLPLATAHLQALRVLFESGAERLESSSWFHLHETRERIDRKNPRWREYADLAVDWNELDVAIEGFLARSLEAPVLLDKGRSWLARVAGEYGNRKTAGVLLSLASDADRIEAAWRPIEGKVGTGAVLRDDCLMAVYDCGDEAQVGRAMEVCLSRLRATAVDSSERSGLWTVVGTLLRRGGSEVLRDQGPTAACTDNERERVQSLLRSVPKRPGDVPR